MESRNSCGDVARPLREGISFSGCLHAWQIIPNTSDFRLSDRKEQNLSRELHRSRGVRCLRNLARVKFSSVDGSRSTPARTVGTHRWISARECTVPNHSFVRRNRTESGDRKIADAANSTTSFLCIYDRRHMGGFEPLISTSLHAIHFPPFS